MIIINSTLSISSHDTILQINDSNISYSMEIDNKSTVILQIPNEENIVNHNYCN